MRIKIFTISILISTALLIQAMEKDLTVALLSEKPTYHSLFNKTIQLKLLKLKEPCDHSVVYNKIAAQCSHTTRCVLQLTCKQFYHAASINNLDKLVIHDFTIGDQTEKNVFFKALIKTNNPELIKPFVNYAKKETEHFFKNGVPTDMQSLHSSPLRYKTPGLHLREFYLHPLLQEAIEQNNEIMIHRLEEENIDKEIVKKYYDSKCTIDRCLLITLCCPLLCCCIMMGAMQPVEDYD